jgi:acyl dehydratase
MMSCLDESLNCSFYFFINRKGVFHLKTGKTIHELTIGEQASITKRIEQKDVETFGHITGDYNPAHFDEAYAATTMFKKRIAHGMLIGSLFSPVLASKLPGPGVIYVSQSLKFTRPVYFGDEITATVTVSEIDVEKNRVTLLCEAKNQEDTLVIKGEAVMMPRKDTSR